MENKFTEEDIREIVKDELRKQESRNMRQELINSMCRHEGFTIEEAEKKIEAIKSKAVKKLEEIRRIEGR